VSIRSILKLVSHIALDWLWPLAAVTCFILVLIAGAGCAFGP
jgi:hypothetical protein